MANGNLLGSSEAFTNGWSNPYRYDGRDGARYDAATGLYWLSVRAHDPTLGRFLSRDPLNRAPLYFADNPYVYAGNNPLSNVDPSGQRYVQSAGSGKAAKPKSASPTRTQSRNGNPKRGGSPALPAAVLSLLHACGACDSVWQSLLKHGKNVLGWVGVGLMIIGLFLDFLALNAVMKSAESADLVSVLSKMVSIFRIMDLVLSALSTFTSKLGAPLEGMVQILASSVAFVPGIIKWATALAVGMTWWVALSIRAGIAAASETEDGELAPVDTLLTAVAGTAIGLFWAGFASVFTSAGLALAGWSNL